MLKLRRKNEVEQPEGTFFLKKSFTIITLYKRVIFLLVTYLLIKILFLILFLRIF